MKIMLMKIMQLNLENFQGIKTATFDFQGQSASIYGDNATGKTTVFNALTWLLFDRPSTGAKNFTPKTMGANGELHGLNHVAEAQFLLDDGRLMTLRKVFHENYRKKRGSAVEEFDGHSVDFYIDGVPVKEKEYTASLQIFCGGSEKMKMLTMPHYFAEDMSWDARRKILLEVCGDVSDDDVIASDADLAELNHYLLKPGTTDLYSVDEYKKIAASKKVSISKQLQGIPGRIDEAKRASPEESIDVGEIDTQLAALQSSLDRLTEQKAAVLAGDTATVETRRQTMEAETALAKAKISYANRTAIVHQKTYEAISALQAKISAAESDRMLYDIMAAKIRQKLEGMTRRRQELRQEYASVRAEVWDENQAVCPTCHRELPAGDTARIRNEFNLRKSNRLQAINEKGRKEASKQAIAGLQQEAATYEAEVERKNEEIKRLSQEKSALESELQTIVPFEQTEEFTRLSATVAACRAAEAGTGNRTAKAVESLNAQFQATYDEVQRLEQMRGRAGQVEVQRQRIAELEAQEKDLSAQYEELEKGIYLCSIFTNAKVRMLTERINGKFKNVCFRLFVEQQNGGVRDDCEVLVPNDTTGALVPYRDANNAARINAGLEIIEVLANHWKISMPVFIDNAESVTRLARTDMQTIRLVVSERDLQLRLELDEVRRENKAA